MEAKLQHCAKYRSYYYSACMVCWKTENVKCCVKCKIASYCCKEHQKMDWPHHKDYCAHLAQNITGVLDDLHNLTLFELSFILTKNAIYKKKLLLYETNMIVHLRTCLTCSSNKDLTMCAECKCVSFCAKHYQENYNKHKKDCLELKTCFEIDKFTWEVAPFIPQFSVNSIIPENTLLEDGYKYIQSSYNLPSSLDRILKEQALSKAQSMIYVLEKIGLIKNRQFFKNRLTLHHVACENEHKTYTGSLLLAEFLMHWLEKLQHIKYIFVRDEIGKNEKSVNRSEQIEAEMYVSEYHEIAEITFPDVIFIDNLILDDKSIYRILQFNVPICLFTFTSIEMEKSIEELKSFGITSRNYILKHVKNPFYNKRPYRNCFYAEDSIVYEASFFSVFKPNL